MINLMPRKATIKKAPVKKEKVIMVHDCTQSDIIATMKENIGKLSIIITGNGDPEHSLNCKVAIIGERQNEVITKLGEVHTSLKEYHTEIDEAKGVALTAKHAIEDYKLEMNTAEQTKEKGKQEKRARLLKNVEVVSCIIGAIGLIITTYFSASGSAQSYKNYKAMMTNNSQLKAIENTVGVDTTAKKDTLKMQ
jgi:hypothetical protein